MWLEPRHAATVGVMVGKEFWGKGVAHDAQEVILRFLFLELGLRVVRLWTHSGNPRAIGLAEKAGFKVAIRQREAIYKGGELLDNVGMDLLREEYFVLHPDLVDTLPLLG
jgi:ribosomal-protein-alanine N-acetyltransferase